MIFNAARYTWAVEPQTISTLTPHQDVNEILCTLAQRLRDVLGDQLVGLYLTGSLTYGDFHRGSSDIDFLAILDRPLARPQHEEVQALHRRIGETYPVWAERIEGSYITQGMLESTVPPQTPRPYLNGGKFWDPDPRYGNEWLLNLHVLYERGVALVGPEPRTLFGPVDINAVREASRKDLLEEWEPKLKDESFFQTSHYVAYVILTLCRILHRARYDTVASKRVAAAWVKRTYGKPWSDVIEQAERWQHGQELNLADEAKNFVKFAVAEVSPPKARAGKDPA